MESEELFEVYNEADATGRIFTLLFNSSNLVSPAYAAAIVLGISFGIAALIGLLYYALIGGFDSSSSSYGSYSSYFNFNRFFRRRRSTLEDDIDLLFILEALDSTEKNISKLDGGNLIDTKFDNISPCTYIFKTCQVADGQLTDDYAKLGERKRTMSQLFQTARQTVSNIKTKSATWQPGIIGNNNKRILEILEGVALASNYLKTDADCEDMRQQCNDKVP